MRRRPRPPALQSLDDFQGQTFAIRAFMRIAQADLDAKHAALLRPTSSRFTAWWRRVAPHLSSSSR